MWGFIGNDEEWKLLYCRWVYALVVDYYIDIGICGSFHDIM